MDSLDYKTDEEDYRCPECQSYDLKPVSEPDEDGFIEYRCNDCGHYFVE